MNAARAHVAAAVVAGCMVAFPAALAASEPNLAELLRIGQGLAEAVKPPGPVSDLDYTRRGFGTIEAPKVEAELATLLAELRAVAPGEAPEVRAYITPDPAFGAHATPEGSLLVAYGVLTSVESRDELAALLAHEYAHVALGHSGPSTAAQLTKSLGAVGELYLSHRYAGVEGIDDMRGKDIQRVVGYGLAMESVQSGLMPSRSRKQERAADRYAAAMLVAAGYNPTAMVDLMSRMGSWEAARAAAAERREQAMVDIEKAAREAAEKGDLGGAMNSVISGGIHNLFAAGTNAVGRGLAKLRRDHDSAEARLDAIVEHIAEEFPDAARPELRPLPWAEDADVKALFAGIDDTHALLEALATDDSKRLDELSNSVRRSPAAAAPLARYALMQLRGSRQTRDERIEVLVREISRPDSLFNAHLAALDHLEEISGTDEDLAALALSREELADPPELVPYAVRFYRRAGDQTRATLELNRCMGIGGAVRAACESAVK